jgi:DNA modification methylase
MSVTILKGDCRDVLRSLPPESVHCVVPSPPYWGLRDYGIPPSVWGGDRDCEHEWGEEIAVNATNHTTKARWNHTRNGRDELQPIEKRVSWLRTEVKQGQFCQHCGAWAGAHGLEPTFALYVAHEVEIFREVRRVLRSDGTLWLNLGDSYATGAGKVGQHPGGGEQGVRWLGTDGSRGPNRPDRNGRGDQQKALAMGPVTQPNRMPQPGLKAKDLCGIPWRVAFALQEDGWWLRQDIIWSKPNPMPESVTDRCTKAHEYLFLLSKSERYYFDQDAIREPFADASLARLAQDVDAQAGSEPRAGQDQRPDESSRSSELERLTFDGPRDLAVRPDTGRKRSSYRPGSASNMNDGEHVAKSDAGLPVNPAGRNKRSVWEVTTQPFSLAHFATFPPALIEPCILAGCPEGGTVLDPFGGAGTTGLVADRLKRNAILIELNPDYAAMAERRIKNDAPLFVDVSGP